ncbi:hypothetical protein G3I71_45590, partial [Streptomyces sp. SID12501]|nr:hypothetical protein [Streptomyces sp. SID12501]
MGVTAVTEVGSFGQQVTQVVLEYGADVDASGLTPADFRVEDSGYNFRFAGIETRAVEPLDQLLRKGETSKEVYVLRRLQEDPDAPAELSG